MKYFLWKSEKFKRSNMEDVLVELEGEVEEK